MLSPRFVPFLMLDDTITEMRVLIFEGIATSGKSTAISSLQKALPDLKVLVVGESETHEPIMKETTDKHVGFFVELINREASENPDLLIFDRLYLTQAFRAKSDISDFSKIEKLLSQYTPLTIFLKVDEETIEDRISKASEHRGPDYFKFRGTTKERAQYYINQQRHQLKLLERSTLPYKVINATDHNTEGVIRLVVTFINKK